MIAILAALALLSAAADAALPTNCGKPAIQPLLTGSFFEENERIVSNTEATQNSWPWQMQLRLNGGHYCGGSVIANEWVLTAAHCVFGKTASQYSLRAGRHTRSGTGTADKNEQISAARQLVVHESYSSSALTNDVALIRLSTPLTFNDYVTPICLTDAEPAANTNAWVTGWGNVQGTCCDGKLKQALLPIVSRSTCSQTLYWGRRITSDMVCAGYDEGYPSGCNGDSGGPLVVQTTAGGFKQVGIVSWGSSSCQEPKKPNVYANVNYFATWIKGKVAEYEAQDAQVKAKNFHPRLGAAFRALAESLEH